MQSSGAVSWELTDVRGWELAVANAASDAWNAAKDWGAKLAKGLADAAMKLGGPVTELFEKFEQLTQSGANAFGVFQTIVSRPAKVAQIDPHHSGLLAK